MRTRRLDALRTDVRELADIEGALTRHPDAKLNRYLNQGAVEHRGIVIEVRGRGFFRKLTPQTITTSATATRYALNSDFESLISVRVATDPGHTLEPFTPQDEPRLRASLNGVGEPTHYELQPGFIEILPRHSANLSIVVEYVPTFTDLVADSDTLNDYFGTIEYVVAYAARRALLKDEEFAHARALETDMARVEARTRAMAAKVDRFRADRIQDVRGGGLALPPGWTR